jgi:tape measure domain-containing protein
MSDRIERAVTEMVLDPTGFKKGVVSVLKEISILNKNMGMTAGIRGIGNFQKAANRFTLSPIVSGLDNVTTKFNTATIVWATAINRLTNAVINASKRFFTAAVITPLKTGMQEYETQMNAIQTILSNTRSKGTGLEDVNKALDELNEYADLTIYNFTHMTSAIGKFTAAGVGLETSVGAIKGIANLAAVSGSSSQEASNAMYQLSQALASGTVRLMDWRSVENMGMGGELFKQLLIDFGEVNGAIKEAEVNTSNFRDSLADKWLSAEVLLGALQAIAGEMTDEDLKNWGSGFSEEQIADIQAMAKDAVAAATEVKTLTQLIDTVQEAIQSGWAMSWRLMIGDFEEAKALYSEISGIFEQVITQSADNRNRILNNWRAIGGRRVAIDSFITAFQGIVDIVDLAREAFQEVFKPLTGNDLTNFTYILSNWASMFDLTSSQAIRFKIVMRGIASALGVLGTLASAIFTPIRNSLRQVDLSIGSNALILSNWLWGLQKAVKEGGVFTKIVGEIGKIFKTVGSTIKEFITPITLNFNGIIPKIQEFADSFEISEHWLDQVANITRGVIAAFDILWMLVKAIAKPILNLVAGLAGLSGGFVETLGSVGDFVFNLRNAIKETGYFDKLVSAVIASMKFLYVAISEAEIVKDLAAYFKSLDGTGLTSFIEVAKKAFRGLGLAIWEIGKAFNSAYIWIKELRQTHAVLEFFRQFTWQGMDQFLNEVISKVPKIVERFNEFKASVERVKLRILEIKETIANLATIKGLIALIKSFDGSGIRSFGQYLADIFNYIRSVYTSIATKINDFWHSLDEYRDKAKEVFIQVGGFIANMFKSFIFDPEGIDWSNITTAVGVGLAISIGKGIKGVLKGTFIVDILEKFLGKESPLVKLLTKQSILSGTFLTDTLEKFLGENSPLVEGVKSLFGEFEGVFVSLQNTLKSEALMKIAGAIALVALSMWAIASIPSEKMIPAIAAIGALMAELVAAYGVLNAIDPKSMIGVSVTIIGLAGALILMSFAMKALEDMSWDDMQESLSAMGLGLAGFIGSIKALSVGPVSKGLVKYAIGLAAFSLALWVFAKALKAYSTMEWDEIEKGLVATGAAFAGFIAGVKALAFGPKPQKMIATAVAMGLMSLSLMIFAKAVKEFGMTDPGVLAIGLIAVGAALASFVVFFKTLAMGARQDKYIAIAVAMGIMSVSLIALGAAVRIFGTMNPEQLAIGLLAVAGTLALFVGFFKMMGTGLDSVMAAAAIFVMAASLEMLSGVLADMASLSWEELGRGLLGMAGTLAMLAISVNLMNGALMGAAAMIIVSIAMLAIGAALKMLATLSWDQLLIALAALGGTLLILGVAAYLLGPVMPVLFAISVAIGLIGLAFLGFGAGLLMASMGLVAIAGSAVAIGKAIEIVGTAISDVLPKVGEGLANMISSFITTMAEKGPEIMQAGVDMLLMLVDAAVTATPDIVAGAIAIITAILEGFVELYETINQAGWDLLMEFLTGIEDNIAEVTTTVANIITEFCTALEAELPQIVDAAFGLIVAFVTAIGDALVEHGPELVGYFYSKAEDAIQGFIDGVEAMKDALIAKAGAMAQEFIDNFTSPFRFGSPSRLFTERGSQTIQGFVIGVLKERNSLMDAMSKVSAVAQNGMTNAVNAIQERLSEMDVRPVIRPLLDMSDVDPGLRRLNTAFAGGLTANISGGFERDRSSIDRAKVGATAGDSIHYIQNNYSPKALDEVEIYRQTRSQIGKLKNRSLS